MQIAGLAENKQALSYQIGWRLTEAIHMDLTCLTITKLYTL